MIIAIDLTSLSYHVTGIERYALCISENMILQDKESEFVLVFREQIYDTFRKYIDNKRVKAVVLHGNNKLIFNQIILPLKLYFISADVYLFLAFTSPILFWKKGIITTIHDMGVWDFSQALSLLQKIYCRVGIRVSAKCAESILTVSEYSKERICKLLHIPKRKVKVVYSAVAEKFNRQGSCDFCEIRKKYNLPEKYVMTLSTLEPRKNMALLLEAFSRIAQEVDYDVVLVGRKGWKTEALISSVAKTERIHLTGFVEDDEVAEIYKNAMCFVFSTAYEGFGLPPVEALAMGTPVVSSDAASMPEVLRNQAVFFENGNISELAEILLHVEEQVANMPKELDEYQKQQYRFDISAKKIIKIIKQYANRNVV